ncbi:hypothetical protein BLA29_013263, partial [Euroglyphus maynei]
MNSFYHEQHVPPPPPPPPPPPASILSVKKSNLSKPLQPLPSIRTDSPSPPTIISSTIPNNRPRSRVEFSANQFHRHYHQHHNPIPNKSDYFFTQPYYPYYYRQYYLNNFNGIDGNRYYHKSGY